MDIHDLSIHKALAPQKSLDELNHENEKDLQQLAYIWLLDFHASSMDEPPLSCKYCNLTLPSNNDLDVHLSGTHEQQTTVPFICVREPECGCENCCNTQAYRDHSNVHLHDTHDSLQVDPLFTCDLCGLSFTITDDLNDHVQRRHMIQSHETSSLASNTLLNSNNIPARLLEEQVDLSLSLKIFQETTSAQLSEIRETQQVLKATLNQIILDSNTCRSSISICLENLQVSVNNLANKITPPVSTKDAPESLATPPNDPIITTSVPYMDPSCSSLPSNSSSFSSSANQASPETFPSLENPVRTSNSNTKLQPSRTATPPTRPGLSSPAGPSSTLTRGRLPTSQREKVLFITDSIGRNSNIRHLEEATNTLIYVEKAYGAQYKVNALFPHQNFCQVAPNVALKRDYKYAVFQGASIDITNLDTTNHTTANEAFWHQEVLISSQNMISAAEALISANPNIETVHILDRIPRFDPASLDPSSLKQALSDYGNRALREEVMKSPLKDRIVIQSHSLPGHCLEEVYGSPLISGYDGVHMYGPNGRDLYTHSVCNIFQRIFNKHARSSHNHKLPTTMTNTSHLHPIPITKNNTVPSYRSKPAPLPGSSSGYSQADYPATSNPRPQKLDHIVIEIEPENNQNDENLHLSYSIPTSNYFSILGNY